MSKGKMITEMTVKAKVVIPTKSRIAAWWMLAVGSTVGAICLALLLVGWLTGGIQDEFGFVFYIFGLGGIAIFIFYIVPGLLVLKGGIRGWMIASAILSLATFGLLIRGGSLPFLIPLTLIILDHISSKRAALLLIILMVITSLLSLIIPDILI